MEPFYFFCYMRNESRKKLKGKKNKLGRSLMPNNAEGNKRKLDFNANWVFKCKDCEMMNFVSEDVCDFPLASEKTFRFWWAKLIFSTLLIIMTIILQPVFSKKEINETCSNGEGPISSEIRLKFQNSIRCLIKRKQFLSRILFTNFKYWNYAHFS